jgi:uncharacterized lipoprotein
MKLHLKTLFVLTSISAVAGCASIGDTGKIFHVRETAYLQSHSTPPLAIPPDLSSNKFQPYYEILPGSGEISASPSPTPPSMTPMPRLNKRK